MNITFNEKNVTKTIEKQIKSGQRQLEENPTICSNTIRENYLSLGVYCLYCRPSGARIHILIILYVVILLLITKKH